MELVTNPVLVVEIVDPVQESWLLLWVGTIKVKSFGFIVESNDVFHNIRLVAPIKGLQVISCI